MSPAEPDRVTADAGAPGESPIDAALDRPSERPARPSGGAAERAPTLASAGAPSRPSPP